MNKKAFTLIELMITISIIAMLATIALPIYDRMILKARSDEAKAVIQSIVFAQERFRQENGRYYPSNTEVTDEELIHNKLRINLSESNNFIYSISTAVAGYDSFGNVDGNFTVKATLRRANRDICNNGGAICKQNGTIDEDAWVAQFYPANNPDRFLLLRYPTRLSGNIVIDGSTMEVEDFMEGGISYARLHED
jgi:prepilin-type N-terminal cleavage/methylation domain-containing protein